MSHRLAISVRERERARSSAGAGGSIAFGFIIIVFKTEEELGLVESFGANGRLERKVLAAVRVAEVGWLDGGGMF